MPKRRKTVRRKVRRAGRATNNDLMAIHIHVPAPTLQRFNTLCKVIGKKQGEVLPGILDGATAAIIELREKELEHLRAL